MPDLQDSLTAVELHNIRVQLNHSPRSLADLLGINIATYYHWEKTGRIPRTASMAVRLLALRPPDTKLPPLRQRSSRTFKSRFLPGARFGSLVVVSPAPPLAGSLHRRVKVRCDCGLEKTLRATVLETMTQCGQSCKTTNHPAPTACTPPPMEGGDTPDLDAPAEEWSAYNVRMLKEGTPPVPPTAAAVTEEDWEAGL